MTMPMTMSMGFLIAQTYLDHVNDNDHAHDYVHVISHYVNDRALYLIPVLVLHVSVHAHDYHLLRENSG